MPQLEWLFGTAGAPRGTAMLWRSELVTLHALSDAVIAISALAVAAAMIWCIRHRPGLLRDYRLVATLFYGFIVAAAVTSLLSVASIWYAIHGLHGLAKALTAALLVGAVVAIRPLLSDLVRLPSPQQLAEVNERLRGEAAAHETTLRELEAARRELESRIEQRTRELSLVKARFETALHGAKVYLFSQDRDLKYTWLYSPAGEEASAGMIGRTDDELLAPPERDAVVAAKRRVLETGEPADLEVSAVRPGYRALYALHVDPAYDRDDKIDGLMCAAIDISRIRSLESEQRRLADELATVLQRYEMALRGSHVTVYTQDRNLRYTSISNGMFGRDPGEIVGRLQQEVLPAESGAPIIAVKRQVLETGQPADAEFRVGDGGTSRWYDAHIEAVRDAGGRIVGLSCAAVDITGRKAGEAHLRELMRELTHRSKNLLAVIQAMVRQTARHANSAEAFVDIFAARLQALAASHDLLVQESWHGASLSELVRSQLAHYLDGDGSQVALDGPALLLKPEAAQSLGLAIHELATNAAKYGSLSVPEGRVGISWRKCVMGETDGIEVNWIESGGPSVIAPTRRGFGSLVVERNLARTLEADIKLEFQPEGVRCRMLIPATNVATGR